MFTTLQVAEITENKDNNLARRTEVFLKKGAAEMLINA